MTNNILIIVAHSDDEALGMGGTIRRHVLRGDNVFVSHMTNGVGARSSTSKEAISKRIDAAKLSSNALGFSWVEKFDFRDNAMDTYPLIEIIKAIESLKFKYKPSMVYTHSNADLNIDHQIIAKSVLTAFRPHPGEFCREIRLFEVPSSTDYGSVNITGRFNPNLFIDVKSFWDDKLISLKGYKMEMRDYPHSRSIEAVENLAKLRGNQVGLELAEAFEVIRKLVS